MFVDFFQAKIWAASRHLHTEGSGKPQEGRRVLDDSAGRQQSINLLNHFRSSKYLLPDQRDTYSDSTISANLSTVYTQLGPISVSAFVLFGSAKKISNQFCLKARR